MHETSCAGCSLTAADVAREPAARLGLPAGGRARDGIRRQVARAGIGFVTRQAWSAGIAKCDDGAPTRSRFAAASRTIMNHDFLVMIRTFLPSEIPKEESPHRTAQFPVCCNCMQTLGVSEK